MEPLFASFSKEGCLYRGAVEVQGLGLGFRVNYSPITFLYSKQCAYVNSSTAPVIQEYHAGTLILGTPQMSYRLNS